MYANFLFMAISYHFYKTFYMAKNTSNIMQNVNPQTRDEAFLTLQIIASFKQHSLSVTESEKVIEISHKHERWLYLIFYFMLILLPLVIIKDSQNYLYPTLFLYFLFLILLFWNITRMTRALKMDLVNKKLILTNLDFIGKILHPSKEIQFHDIHSFETEYLSGKFGSQGKNIILFKTQSNKKYTILNIKSEGVGLSNGNMVCNSLNMLISNAN